MHIQNFPIVHSSPVRGMSLVVWGRVFFVTYLQKKKYFTESEQKKKLKCASPLGLEISAVEKEEG